VAIGVVLAATFSAPLAGPSGGRSQPSSRPADPEPALQRDIYFAPAESWRARSFARGQTILWTDAPVDGTAIVKHLAAVGKYLRERIPPAPADGTTQPAQSQPPPIVLAVYAKRSDYHALWRRVAAYYGGRFGKIATEGFSYRVFFATSYDSPEQFKLRRPVISHEFAHVWLYRRRGLRNDGNWLTEGVATAVQMHFWPESANRHHFARWLDSGRMLPLKRLMDLPRIPPKHYWQAGTLVELILRRYPEKLPAVIAAFNAGASAYSIVANVLQTDFPSLERLWSNYVRSAASESNSSGIPAKRPPDAAPGKGSSR